MSDIHPFAPQFEYAFSIAITLAKAVSLAPTTMGATRVRVRARAVVPARKR